MNLSWITGDLAIGGRLLEAETRDLATAGIGAVIDMRHEAMDEAAVLAAQSIAFLHLPTEDHAAVAPHAIAAGLAFAARGAQEGRRLLIHCEHGIGRSATMALCILVARGLAPAAALRLAKNRRERVSPSPAQYEAWRAWLETRDPVPAIPSFESFAAVAYRHLGRA